MKRQKGVTLVELMVTVSVIGLLAATAVPQFSQWIQDTKTRTVGEALQNGIRLAQAEAVRRGRQVNFSLTNDAPSIDSVASATGKNWVIRAMSLTSANTFEEFVQGATFAGDNQSVAVTATSSSIQFNSVGRVVQPASVVNYTITNSAGSGRRLNVMVTTGGKIRMCDPDKSISTSADGC